MIKRCLSFVLGLIIIVLWWQPLNLGLTEVTIPDNVNAREVGRFLAGQHIVRNIDEFLFWLKVLGRERRLRAGTYELYRYKNPIYVIDRLCRGGRSEVMITIPEGLTIRETARIMADHGLVDYDRFIDLCTDSNFIAKLGLQVGSLEGYIFPDTYSLSRLQDEESIIGILVGNFTRHIAAYNLSNHDSLHQVIVLASIVEKEAKYEDERPIIASVFINRLKLKRPLESCATVLYVLKAEKPMATRQQLSDRDLKVVSPYNTYLHAGLPPGPICSPGESSIRAVISPADVDYLYFVAKGDGRHYFSRTYREHVAAKDRYQ
jgi:UPF0755 protein